MIHHFELHIGFPVHEQAGARRLLDAFQQKQDDWSYSEVYDVHSNPSIIDPHNVPGTLGCLISKDIQISKQQSAKEVITEAQQAISTLISVDAADARMEIEYVFGYVQITADSQEQPDSAFCIEVPPSLPDEWLNLTNAERISETPNSEIHFVIDRPYDISFPAAGIQPPVITIAEASQLIEQNAVKVEQTISYRSQSMRDADYLDRKEKKLICTSYYGSPALAKADALRLIREGDLYTAFAERGYRIKLVLERILACFKPVPF